MGERAEGKALYMEIGKKMAKSSIGLGWWWDSYVMRYTEYRLVYRCFIDICKW